MGIAHVVEVRLGERVAIERFARHEERHDGALVSEPYHLLLHVLDQIHEGEGSCREWTSVSRLDVEAVRRAQKDKKTEEKINKLKNN